MDELIAFLRAQLDKRERAARYVLSDYAEHEASWDVPSTGVVQLGDDLVPTGDGPLAEFIADNDPEFVLADVAAKRRILELYEAADPGFVGHLLRNCLDVPLRLLALPYAGQPGYDESWRPAVGGV